MTTSANTHTGKVLVVDDEPQNLQLVGENLRRADIPFIFAINGDEALSVVREDAPSLILLDVMMPGKSGFEVCNELKAYPKTAHIPIIFLTAASSTSDLVSGFASGAVDYIRKPFIREELLARVRTHLHLQNVRSQLDQQAHQRADLLTRLAHDIKNPSSGISGLVRLLREDIETGTQSQEETHSILDLIDNCALGMNEMVKGILDEAEETQSETINPAIQVEDVLQHLVDLNAIHAQSRNIQITLDAQQTPSVTIGRRILNEMFDNLLSNAVKYSRPDSCIQVRIVEAERITSGFRVEVEDCAPLIAPEKSAALFQRFAKGDYAPEGSQSSHGIGLSVVKRLVDFHRGIVGIQRSPDSLGNIFFIELPTAETIA
ncbi:MAG: hybrid sensor histidine kinase/response regulator [Coraliomargarita sp.]